MPYHKKTRRPLLARFKKRPLLVLGVVLLLLVTGAIAYTQIRDEETANQPASDASDQESGDYINLNPPTEEDKQETEANKKSLSEDRPSPPPTSNGKKQVTPVITSVDGGKVYAYVPGIFEDGGTCKATATKGSQTKTAKSTAFANVSDTSCAPISISLSGSGWSVVVSYSSSTSQGQSEAFEVN